MKNTCLTVFIGLIFTCCFTAYAQDHVLLLTGKEIKAKVLSETEFEIKVEFMKKQELRQQLIEKYRVYSYTRQGKETIIYVQDSSMGNDLTEEEMRHFIYGERDAYNTYKPTVSVIGGVIIGGAAGAYMGYDGGIILVATPFVYSMAQLIPKVKINQKKIPDKSMLIKEDYLYGYERVARSRKVQRSLLSSVLSFGAGFAISAVIVNNQ